MKEQWLSELELYKRFIEQILILISNDSSDFVQTERI